MSGGILQLIATGVADIYLTGNPQITWFKIIYRRHTQFSMDDILMRVDANFQFGSTYYIKIPSFADRLNRVTLIVDIDQPIIKKCSIQNINDVIAKYDIEYKVPAVIDNLNSLGEAIMIKARQYNNIYNNKLNILKHIIKNTKKEYVIVSADKTREIIKSGIMNLEINNFIHHNNKIKKIQFIQDCIKINNINELVHSEAQYYMLISQNIDNYEIYITTQNPECNKYECINHLFHNIYDIIPTHSHMYHLHNLYMYNNNKNIKLYNADEIKHMINNEILNYIVNIPDNFIKNEIYFYINLSTEHNIVTGNPSIKDYYLNLVHNQNNTISYDALIQYIDEYHYETYVLDSNMTIINKDIIEYIVKYVNNTLLKYNNVLLPVVIIENDDFIDFKWDYVNNIMHKIYDNIFNKQYYKNIVVLNHLPIALVYYYGVQFNINVFNVSCVEHDIYINGCNMCYKHMEFNNLLKMMLERFVDETTYDVDYNKKYVIYNKNVLYDANNYIIMRITSIMNMTVLEQTEIQINIFDDYVNNLFGQRDNTTNDYILMKNIYNDTINRYKRLHFLNIKDISTDNYYGFSHEIAQTYLNNILNTIQNMKTTYDGYHFINKDNIFTLNEILDIIQFIGFDDSILTDKISDFNNIKNGLIIDKNNVGLITKIHNMPTISDILYGHEHDLATTPIIFLKHTITDTLHILYETYDTYIGYYKKTNIITALNNIKQQFLYDEYSFRGIINKYQILTNNLINKIDEIYALEIDIYRIENVNNILINGAYEIKESLKTLNNSHTKYINSLLENLENINKSHDLGEHYELLKQLIKTNITNNLCILQSINNLKHKIFYTYDNIKEIISCNINKCFNDVQIIENKFTTIIQNINMNYFISIDTTNDTRQYKPAQLFNIRDEYNNFQTYGDVLNLIIYNIVYKTTNITFNSNDIIQNIKDDINLVYTKMKQLVNIPSICNYKQCDMDDNLYKNAELHTTISKLLYDTPKYAWVKYLGYKLIEDVSLIINGAEIETQNGELMILQHKLFDNPEHKRGIDIMIGNIPDMYNMTTKKEPIRLYIKFNLFFNKDYGNSLPLTNMIYSDSQIKLTLSPIEKLLYIENGILSSCKIKCQLLGTYIYLTDHERKVMAIKKYESLIERLHMVTLIKTIDDITDNILKIRYEFNDPCKYFLWKIEIPGYTKIIDKIMIEFDSQTREKWHDSSFYQLLQPYNKNIGSLDVDEGIYTMCLYPKLLQPSGATNLTQIADIVFHIKINDDIIKIMKNNKLKITMWACTYNIFVAYGGFAALLFYGGR